MLKERWTPEMALDGGRMRRADAILALLMGFSSGIKRARWGFHLSPGPTRPPTLSGLRTFSLLGEMQEEEGDTGRRSTPIRNAPAPAEGHCATLWRSPMTNVRSRPIA